MYLNASAILAILAEEEDAGYYIAKLEDTNRQIFCSPLTVYEAVISLARIEATRLSAHSRQFLHNVSMTHRSTLPLCLIP